MRNAPIEVNRSLGKCRKVLKWLLMASEQSPDQGKNQENPASRKRIPAII
jgi:hypothetical protein